MQVHCFPSLGVRRKSASDFSKTFLSFPQTRPCSSPFDRHFQTYQIHFRAWTGCAGRGSVGRNPTKVPHENEITPWLVARSFVGGGYQREGAGDIDFQQLLRSADYQCFYSSASDRPDCWPVCQHQCGRCFLSQQSQFHPFEDYEHQLFGRTFHRWNSGGAGCGWGQLRGSLHRGLGQQRPRLCLSQC